MSDARYFSLHLPPCRRRVMTLSVNGTTSKIESNAELLPSVRVVPSFLRWLLARSCVVVISPNDSSIIAKLIQFSPSPSPVSFSEVLLLCPVGRLFRHKTEDSDASSVKAAIHCHQNDPSACTAIYSFCRMMSDVATKE